MRGKPQQQLYKTSYKTRVIKQQKKQKTTKTMKILVLIKYCTNYWSRLFKVPIVRRLQWLLLVIGCKSLAPVFQPTRSKTKTKTNRTLSAWFFPHFEQVTGMIHFIHYSQLLGILISSLGCLLLLWLVRVIAVVLFFSTIIWKPLWCNGITTNAPFKPKLKHDLMLLNTAVVFFINDLYCFFLHFKFSTLKAQTKVLLKSFFYTFFGWFCFFYTKDSKMHSIQSTILTPKNLSTQSETREPHE